MKRLLCLAFLLAAASGAQAQDSPTPDEQDEQRIRDAYDRAAMFQVLHVTRIEGEGYVYFFEPSQSFQDQDARGEPRVLYSQGGALIARSTGVSKAIVFVESSYDGYSGLAPNGLLLTEDNPVGRMETTQRDGRPGPFLSSHTIRVLVCTSPADENGCDRWIEATPPGADGSDIFYGTELLIIRGPELGGEARPVDD
ncbi:hypothetical protein [Rubricoccus marinus]|uniref:Uncharacterized protein n=1 Tax=Rubricoccus marinus TaxID=716817 RepID=A0A259U1E0_9BACT|nr:hypothetical protein [Rubricoccus marinus]OZC03658.1 hypothetical protein BSZ36_12115 [Rubricoccus marinus]